MTDSKDSKRLIVGLTGGIGSGKTAATDLFAELGIDIVDADIVARQVVTPGAPALELIKAEFGDEYIDAEGQLNRAKLRALVFSDESAKQKLNAIMQPAIRTELLDQLNQAKSQYVILSAPLLLENGLESYCQRVLVVDVPEALQVQRATNRDSVNEEQIKSIISSQIDRPTRLTKADDVIDNSGSLSELKIQVNQLHKKYLTLADG